MRSVKTLFQLFEKAGFDRPKFSVGLQVSCIAFLCLLLAWLLGFEHPQWAAITVFVTLQPTRGQIIEKSSYRLVGTLAGAAFGTGVVWLADGNLRVELLAVCAWAVLMVWLGALQRAYRSYASLLAGYTAIIIVVLAPFDASEVQEAAIDRVWTVMLGLVGATLWAMVSGLKDAREELRLKARRLCADVLQYAGADLRSPRGQDMAGFARLITGLGTLQDEIAAMTANGRAVGLRATEQLLQSLAVLMLALPGRDTGNTPPPDAALGQRLTEIGLKLSAQNGYQGIARALLKSLSLTENQRLEDVLTALTVHLQALEQPKTPLNAEYEARRRYALDWRGAAQSALRFGLVLGLISLAWVWTGNPLFQLPLVSAAICVALASTGVTPVRKMLDVLRGQVAAGLVAVLTEVWLWPAFSSPLGQILCLAPAALIFAFLRSHRRMTLAAPDFAIMVFLLLSPSSNAYVAQSDPILRAVMAIGGAVLGYLGFLLIFPTDARVRRKGLWRMIKRDLQELTRLRHHSLNPEAWRYSFATRFLRIAHWASLEQGRFERIDITMRKGMVSIRLAEVIFMLRALQVQAALPEALMRAIDAGLERVRVSQTDTSELVRTLHLLMRKLATRGYSAEAQLIGGALSELEDLGRLRRS